MWWTLQVLKWLLYRKLKKAVTEQQDTLAKKILQEKSLLDRMLLKINLRDKESEILTPFDEKEGTRQKLNDLLY